MLSFLFLFFSFPVNSDLGMQRVYLRGVERTFWNQSIWLNTCNQFLLEHQVFLLLILELLFHKSVKRPSEETLITAGWERTSQSSRCKLYFYESCPFLLKSYHIVPYFQWLVQIKPKAASSFFLSTLYP